ncbi:MAG: hypothetical protein Q8Q48_02885 [Candidatus Staskawiczbacteria bacterium]|nr:hypothetical protein [Candidatus Staskawiczbacteria bacterium]
MSLLKKTFFLFFVSVFLALSNFVFALETKYPSILGKTITTETTLPEYAAYFFNFGIFIAGFLAMCVIAFGGIYYLISLSRGSFTDEGKAWVKAGILGLLLIMCAYLIAYTINPSLVYFKLDALSKITSGIFGTDTFGNYPKTEYYTEIPIGVITENLLTRTIDCYDYDFNGDPIAGDKVKTDDNKEVLGPTYLSNDRVDCFFKLAGAVARKTKIVEEVSNKIVELMQSCKCDNTCGTECNSSCSGASCVQPKGIESCCPPDIKKQIEHGNIQIGSDFNPTDNGVDGIFTDQCQGPETSYRGLDEFRTTQYNISSMIEKQVQIKEKTVTIVDIDRYKSLRLIEQLMYLKEKLSKLESKIQKDLDQTNEAEDKISKCYLIKPYIDILKTKEQTKKEDTIIVPKKIFSDPVSGESINPAKYCDGFNYSNTENYQNCQEACPVDFNCYKDCGQCEKDDEKCEASQKKCIQACDTNRNCTKSDSFSTFKQCTGFYQDKCLTDCGKRYLDCSVEYKICTDQCQANSQCLLDNIDKCSVSPEKVAECVGSSSDPGNAKNCIDNSYLCKSGSNENAGYTDCLKTQCTVYKNGRPSYLSSSCSEYTADYFYKYPNMQQCQNPYKVDSNGNTCLEQYPETSKCPASSGCPQCPCNNVEEKIEFSFGDDDDEDDGGGDGGGGEPCSPGECRGLDGICSPGYCSDDKGKTACESPSDCLYGTTCINGVCTSTGGGGEDDDGGGTGGGGGGGKTGGGGSKTFSLNILGYRITGPQCTGYSYNDDPLTFYCQEEWWNTPEAQNQEAIGGKRSYNKAQEIPVGETIDNAELWAETLIQTIKTLANNTQDMISFMKKIGDKKQDEYCRCDSKFESGSAVCKADCDLVKNVDPDTGKEKITCEITQACTGNSCQQMIDWLKNVSSYYQTAEINFLTLYGDVLLEKGRTDVMKQLTYSREEINDCSVSGSNYGTETRLLNCQRVQHEIIPPVTKDYVMVDNEAINGYCYGQELNKATDGKDLFMDNWFCIIEENINQEEAGLKK